MLMMLELEPVVALAVVGVGGGVVVTILAVPSRSKANFALVWDECFAIRSYTARAKAHLQLQPGALASCVFVADGCLSRVRIPFRSPKELVPPFPLEEVPGQRCLRPFSIC